MNEVKELERKNLLEGSPSHAITVWMDEDIPEELRRKKEEVDKPKEEVKQEPRAM
jgi:hypothetical protein